MTGPESLPPKVAVVMPCYRVAGSVLAVIDAIGPEVERIYVVDDACPEGTGDTVEAQCRDGRVAVLRNKRNAGVGGAVIAGYRRALEDGVDIVVKLDGDGQMNPGLIPPLIRAIVEGKADYTKGNRFYFLESTSTMPRVRLIGNVVLSFLTKVSSGYWSIFDSTNGFTAIHAKVLARLPLGKISADYFFETDMLFRLGILRAVVHDIPMDSTYGSEQSNLRVSRVLLPFLCGNIRNFCKRVFYSYFLRDFQLPSVAIVLGIPLIAFGMLFGALRWAAGAVAGEFASAGQVMLASLPILVGSHLVIMGIGHDVSNEPIRPIHPYL